MQVQRTFGTFKSTERKHRAESLQLSIIISPIDPIHKKDWSTNLMVLMSKLSRLNQVHLFWKRFRLWNKKQGCSNKYQQKSSKRSPKYSTSIKTTSCRLSRWTTFAREFKQIRTITTRFSCAWLDPISNRLLVWTDWWVLITKIFTLLMLIRHLEKLKTLSCSTKSILSNSFST